MITSDKELILFCLGIGIFATLPIISIIWVSRVINKIEKIDRE